MKADRRVWLGFGAISVALAVALGVTRRPSQRLADGTVIVLDKVEVGREFTDAHGTLIEYLFDPFIPSNGVRLGRFEIRRPQKLYSFHRTTPALTAKFSLLGSPALLARSELVRPKFNGQFRVVISGDDDFGYVTGFDSFGRYRDGYISYAETETFPRHSKRLRLAIERRDRVGAPWTRLVEFPATVSGRAGQATWSAERDSRSRSVAGTDFRLGEITVRPTPPGSRAIWKYTARVPLQVAERGIPATNWLGSLELEDASGNHSWGLSTGASDAGIAFRFGSRWAANEPFQRASTNGWMEFACLQPLDPRQVWHVDAAFERFGGFPVTNVFRVEIPAGAFATVFVPVTTNLPEGTLSIDVDTRVVELRLTPVREDIALRLVRVQDVRGHDLRSQLTRLEPGIWQSILGEPVSPQSVPGGKISVTVAVEPILRLDFTARPRLIP